MTAAHSSQGEVQSQMKLCISRTEQAFGLEIAGEIDLYLVQFQTSALVK